METIANKWQLGKEGELQGQLKLWASSQKSYRIAQIIRTASLVQVVNEDDKLDFCIGGFSLLIPD